MTTDAAVGVGVLATERTTRASGTRGPFSELCVALRRRRLDHHERSWLVYSSSRQNSRPLKPLAFQAATRCAHSDEVVMQPSMRMQTAGSYTAR